MQDDRARKLGDHWYITYQKGLFSTSRSRVLISGHSIHWERWKLNKINLRRGLIKIPLIGSYGLRLDFRYVGFAIFWKNMKLKNRKLAKISLLECHIDEKSVLNTINESNFPKSRKINKNFAILRRLKACKMAWKGRCWARKLQ